MEHADSRLKQGKEPFAEILYTALQPKGHLQNPANAFEFQAILDDLLAADAVCRTAEKKNSFLYGKTGFKTDAHWRPAAAVAFRADSIGIVYSDIVALGQDCVLLELNQDIHHSRLKLAPGRKNQNAVNISLYKEGGLIEKLQLQKRIHWDLDRFLPGTYRLVLGKQKSFQFVIRE